MSHRCRVPGTLTWLHSQSVAGRSCCKGTEIRVLHADEFELKRFSRAVHRPSLDVRAPSQGFDACHRAPVRFERRHDRRDVPNPRPDHPKTSEYG